MAGENEATNLSNQVKDLSVNSAQTGNEAAASGDATSGEGVPDVAERSLLQKVIRRGLVENKNDLEIQRKDPKSPLYSVKSFEALNLKTQLLKGKNFVKLIKSTILLFHEKLSFYRCLCYGLQCTLKNSRNCSANPIG